MRQAPSADVLGRVLRVSLALRLLLPAACAVLRSHGSRDRQNNCRAPQFHHGVPVFRSGEEVYLFPWNHQGGP
jgi:hypothetical protein